MCSATVREEVKREAGITPLRFGLSGTYSVSLLTSSLTFAVGLYDFSFRKVCFIADYTMQHQVELELFKAALGLTSPWEVVKCEFNSEDGLELWIDFQVGAKFEDPETKALCPVHDTSQRSWRHMNFWQYQTTLHARVPRIRTPEGKVRLIEVPWVRPGSGFTLMMEALILVLSRQMPVVDVAEMLRVHDTQLWRVIIHHVDRAQAGRDWAKVRRILID